MCVCGATDCALSHSEPFVCVYVGVCDGTGCAVSHSEPCVSVCVCVCV